MEAQPAQQRTSTTPTRPQQPTEAYAATLPVETLTRIFELALEGLVWPDEEKGQAQRVQYGLVCRSWCSAALPLPHYVVTSTAKAERLANVLKAARRSEPKVRSLDISTSPDEGAGRGPRIAKLLAQCPKLERLVLQVGGRLCASGRSYSDGLLGRPVNKACTKLVQLRYVELIGGSLLPNTVLAELLGSWPNLVNLSFHDARYGSHGLFNFTNVSARLSEIYINASDDLNLARSLLKASSNTLERLFVGEVPMNKGEAVVEAIQPVLPQLRSFTIVDGQKLASRGPNQLYVRSAFLEVALKQLTSVESLLIGLGGYDPCNLFTLLTNMKTLRYFYLDISKESETSLLNSLSSDAAIVYLKNAPPALQSVNLPAALWWNYWWPVGDRVKGAGADAGIQVT